MVTYFIQNSFSEIGSGNFWKFNPDNHFYSNWNESGDYYPGNGNNNFQINKHSEKNNFPVTETVIFKKIPKYFIDRKHLW